MGMTDPIADLLTRIRNGAHARKEQVEQRQRLEIGIGQRGDMVAQGSGGLFVHHLAKAFEVVDIF